MSGSIVKAGRGFGRVNLTADLESRDLLIADCSSISCKNVATHPILGYFLKKIGFATELKTTTGKIYANTKSLISHLHTSEGIQGKDKQRTITFLLSSLKKTGIKSLKSLNFERIQEIYIKIQILKEPSQISTDSLTNSVNPSTSRNKKKKAKRSKRKFFTPKKTANKKTKSARSNALRSKSAETPLANGQEASKTSSTTISPTSLNEHGSNDAGLKTSIQTECSINFHGYLEEKFKIYYVNHVENEPDKAKARITLVQMIKTSGYENLKYLGVKLSEINTDEFKLIVPFLLERHISTLIDVFPKLPLDKMDALTWSMDKVKFTDYVKRFLDAGVKKKCDDLWNTSFPFLLKRGLEKKFLSFNFFRQIYLGNPPFTLQSPYKSADQKKRTKTDEIAIQKIILNLLSENEENWKLFSEELITWWSGQLFDYEQINKFFSFLIGCFPGKYQLLINIFFEEVGFDTLKERFLSHWSIFDDTTQYSEFRVQIILYEVLKILANDKLSQDDCITQVIKEISRLKGLKHDNGEAFILGEKLAKFCPPESVPVLKESFNQLKAHRKQCLIDGFNKHPGNKIQTS